MDRSLLGLLDRAFELAYFIEPDKDRALDLVLAAYSRVEVVAENQNKRRYYSAAERTRVSMGKAQLLQRLIYISLDRRDRERPPENLSEDDYSVRYMAHLTRICMRRNAFHVAVGFGRLLFNYSNREVLDCYDLVAQRSDRLKSSDYLRARKKHLMDELEERFGPRLRNRRGRRGERLFAAREPSERLRSLVVRGLELMTPWQTRCTIPETFDPFSQPLRALKSDPSELGDQVEMDRIHALMHPSCLARLTAVLGLETPSSRLDLPELSRPEGGDPSEPPAGGLRHDPPKLGPDDHRDFRARVHDREQRRRRAAAGIFKVRVDGEIVTLWDARSSPRTELVCERGELLEIVTHRADDPVVLAVLLLPQQPVPPEDTIRASVPLGWGRGFELAVLPTAAGLRIRVEFRESFLHRWRSAFGPTPRTPRLAAGLAVAMLLAVGLSYWNGRFAPTSEIPRLRGTHGSRPAISPERMFIESFGSDPVRRQVRDLLVQSFAGPEQERVGAEAILFAGQPSDGGLELRLVGPAGELWWQGRYTLDAPIGELVAAIDRDVRAALEQAPQRQSPWSTNGAQ